MSIYFKNKKLGNYAVVYVSCSGFLASHTAFPSVQLLMFIGMNNNRLKIENLTKNRTNKNALFFKFDFNFKILKYQT